MSKTWNNETAAIDGAEDGNADINADMNAGAMDDASVELDDSIISEIPNLSKSHILFKFSFE